MAKLLLNTRASRITIVDKILLLPAEVKKDEQLGKHVVPSKTLISERSKPGKPSQYSRIMSDRQTRRLVDAGVIRWSDEKVDEPAEPEEELGPDSEEEVDPEPDTEPAPAKLPAAGGQRRKRGQHHRERKAS